MTLACDFFLPACAPLGPLLFHKYSRDCVKTNSWQHDIETCEHLFHFWAFWAEQNFELFSSSPLSFLLKEILFTSFLHKKMDTFLMAYTPFTLKKARAKTVYCPAADQLKSGKGKEEKG